MANYQQDLSTEPGAYLNGHATTAKQLRKGSPSSHKSMTRKKEHTKQKRFMAKGK